jgi:hypothetical protein
MTTQLPFILVSGRDSDLVAYDNATSGLTATDVKAALDELAAADSPDQNLWATVTGDVGSTTANTTTDTLTIAGGTNITTTVVGDTLTIDASLAAGGDVDGPASATDNAIARFDGTTGKLIQNSGVTVDDSDNMTVPGNLTVNGTLTTLDTTNLAIEDTIIQLGTNNNTTDTLDIGFVGLYDTSGSLDLYAGLFRDASDGNFNLFVDSQEDLSATNVINKAATGYTRGTLDANIINGTVSSLASAIAVADGGTGSGTAGGARTNLGLEIGTDVQAYDAGLASIAGLTTAADTMIYTTALDTYATTSLTSFARTLLDDADAATMRTTLGVDASGTDNSTDVTLAGALDYITISGQVITRNAIDLATDVTGDLPFANITQIATDSFLGRDTAGTGDIEVLTATQVRTIINVEDGAQANLTWATTLYADGVDFTAGTSTTLTMPQAAPSDDEDHVLVFYHGLAQHQDQWSISGTTITFTAAIPTGVTDVEVRVLA